MKLIFVAFLFVSVINGYSAAPNIMVYQDCMDRLDTCHLVLKENKCQSSKYYQIYCCTSCGDLQSESQGGEDNTEESNDNSQTGEKDIREDVGEVQYDEEYTQGGEITYEYSDE